MRRATEAHIATLSHALADSSADCCGMRGLWRCDPCERLDPVFDQIAMRARLPASGAWPLLVAKMDVHTNDPPEDLPYSHLPCLKAIGVDGSVEDVPHHVYAEEAHAFARLLRFVDELSREGAVSTCPATSAQRSRARWIV